MEFLGRSVKKEFKGFGVFSGTLRSYNASSRFFEIVYEDSSFEELEFFEVASLFEGREEASAASKLPHENCGSDVRPRSTAVSSGCVKFKAIQVEVLQCLSDDMIEVEAIRSKLSRRSLVAEPDMVFDRSMNLDVCEKRRVIVDVSVGSCLTEEIVEDTTDWNSDECCLWKMDGNLICCDGCLAAYHSKYVGISSDLWPEGDWYCPECVVDRCKPWMKYQKSPRGAELLGIDPHGWLFFSSCSYLLV